jgi:hypothetical protein
MNRVFLMVIALTPALALSGCTLKQPTYNAELGGFPILTTENVAYQDSSNHRTKGAGLDSSFDSARARHRDAYTR